MKQHILKHHPIAGDESIVSHAAARLPCFRFDAHRQTCPSNAAQASQAQGNSFMMEVLCQLGHAGPPRCRSFLEHSFVRLVHLGRDLGIVHERLYGEGVHVAAA
eukprot:2882420-Amphidinium_carterae.1